MQLKNVSGILFIACVVLIISVKILVRPYIPVPPVLQILVDVAPNLLGSFCLPFGAGWLLSYYFRLQTLTELKWVCLLGLLLVLFNEYLQLIQVFGRTFDYLDIIASVAGTLIAYYVYAAILLKTSVYNKVAD